jgi:hypothetical protein
MKEKQTIKKQKGTKMSENDSKIQLRMSVPVAGEKTRKKQLN